MNLRLNVKPIATAFLSMALCTTMVLAQDTSNSSKTVKAQSDSSPGLPDLVELDPFGGISLFGQVNRGLDTKHITGGVFGGRVGINVSNYVGLELMYEHTNNNVRFLTPIAAGVARYDFGNRIHVSCVESGIPFYSRGSRIRPYVTVVSAPHNSLRPTLPSGLRVIQALTPFITRPI